MQQLSKAKIRLTQLESMDYRNHKDHNREQHENAILQQKLRITRLEKKAETQSSTFPPAPSVSQKKGTLGLKGNQIKEISRKEAEQLRKQQAEQKKQIELKLEKFTKAEEKRKKDDELKK